MKDGGIIIPDSAVQKQTLHFKDSDALVILAKGDSWPDGQQIARKENCECWGLNDCVRIPEMTMLFDLHEKERALKTSPDLPTLKIPVMMQEKHLDIPTSVKFPMNQLLNDFKVSYYNNQICQMIAFAIHTRRFKRLYLFGVDYCAVDRVEQEFERPCTEFWLGMAMMAGISIFISKQSNLMTYVGYHKGIIYGYTPDYQKPFEGFRQAMPHYWAEYILGNWGGCAIGKEVYDHDEFYNELAKFTTLFVQKKMKQKAELEAKKKAPTKKKPARRKKK